MAAKTDFRVRQYLVSDVCSLMLLQLLLRFASLHQTGNDLQEDPTTRSSEPLNRI